jgi:glycosyltransferase involved in cell wall biosynthesis
MGKANISIIVCTCNRAGMLPQAIRSLLEQKTASHFKFEILIVDDGSTDNTADVVASLMAENPAAPLRYRYKSPGGVADARNFGARHAAGEWIAFFDDDQIADSEWLSELIAIAREKNAECVGGSVSLLLPESNRLKLGPRARGILGERYRGKLSKAYAPNDYPGTGNVLFTKKVFEEVGGFDTKMREGGEDTEFFARLRKKGITIWYTPKALAWHVIPPSRLTLEFLRWVSRKGGVAAVRLDYKSGDLSLVIFRVLCRVIVLVVRDVPIAIMATAQENQALKLDCLCTVGHTVGYLRGCLHFLSPRIFQQKHFMEYVDFRRHGGERTI